MKVRQLFSGETVRMIECASPETVDDVVADLAYHAGGDGWATLAVLTESEFSHLHGWTNDYGNWLDRKNGETFAVEVSR